MRQLLQDADFADIHILRGKVSFGIWPKNPDLKHAGKAMLLSVHEPGYEMYSAYNLVCSVLGMALEDMRKWC